MKGEHMLVRTIITHTCGGKTTTEITPWKLVPKYHRIKVEDGHETKDVRCPCCNITIPGKRRLIK